MSFTTKHIYLFNFLVFDSIIRKLLRAENNFILKVFVLPTVGRRRSGRPHYSPAIPSNATVHIQISIHRRTILRDFLLLLVSLQARSAIAPQIMSQQNPFSSFPIHYSLVILPIDTTYPELLKASLHKAKTTE